jgi:hypothetical protein
MSIYSIDFPQSFLFKQVKMSLEYYPWALYFLTIKYSELLSVVATEIRCFCPMPVYLLKKTHSMCYNTYFYIEVCGKWWGGGAQLLQYGATFDVILVLLVEGARGETLTAWSQ